jgi:hypothetical protein
VNATLQLVIVAGALLWSLGFMLRRQFPATMRGLQQHLSAACRQRGWRGLGEWLSPAEKVAAGCDNGCSSCSPACAADKAAPTAERPVQWRQPPSSGACH